MKTITLGKTMKTIPFGQTIDPILTHANAHAWDSSEEKYLFVVDLLEDLDITSTDARVRYVEQRFEAILDGTETID